MEYRKLPHGEERLSALGLGTGSIYEAPAEEIEQVIRTAIANGINFFDLCGGGRAVYEPFGRAIAGQREKVYFQLHFGAIYDEKGEYGWSRDLNVIRETFAFELQALGTDYVDFGFLHCIDKDADLDEVLNNGIYDYVRELKAAGIVRHIGFSSHTPSVANRLLDLGGMDLMLFSINPAYDLEQGDTWGIGSTSERAALFRRCEAEGVGISVMKPFHGGKLLDANTSPFHEALTHAQCLQYALDRPGVLSVVPGVRNMADLEQLLPFITAPAGQKDYSIIGKFTPERAIGNCVYCNHCLPCPAGLDIGLINKYYDLACAGDQMAASHYEKLELHAQDCLHCGHCDGQCPFQVAQSDRMTQIEAYFGT